MTREHPKFDAAMFNIYNRAKKEALYSANIFLDMLMRRKGIATAKQLINAPTESVGYTALYERGRLDLTVEAMVVESLEWRALFTDEEVARAETRLTKYRYTWKTPT